VSGIGGPSIGLTKKRSSWTWSTCSTVARPTGSYRSLPPLEWRPEQRCTSGIRPDSAPWASKPRTLDLTDSGLDSGLSSTVSSSLGKGQNLAVRNASQAVPHERSLHYGFAQRFLQVGCHWIPAVLRFLHSGWWSAGPGIQGCMGVSGSLMPLKKEGDCGQGRQKRSLPLWQRQEVQEVLFAPGRRSSPGDERDQGAAGTTRVKRHESAKRPAAGGRLFCLLHGPPVG